MNILHIESSKNWGGQEYRTVAEVRWLRGNGHRAWIVCSPDSELARRAPQLCEPVHLRRSLDPVALMRIRRLCRRRNIDVVHVHSPKDAWICAPLQLTIGPAVVRSRQITNPVKPQWSRSIVYRRGCAHVVAASESIRTSLVTHNRVAPDRISVIGEGVDLREFFPEVDGRGFRAEFSIRPDAVLFGMVAMIRGEKGHLDFIAAAAKVARRHPAARFAIVGEGTGDRSHEKLVRARAREWLPHGPLCFTGYRADTPQVMAALDVLVVPSHAEAQSLVVPQAFATRRAVVATKVGGLPELVEHGKTGLLIPPADPSALADAMERLIKDVPLRRQLAAAGHDKARRELGFDGKMHTTLSLYRRVYHDRRRRARARWRLPRTAISVLGSPLASSIAALLVFAWLTISPLPTAPSAPPRETGAAISASEAIEFPEWLREAIFEDDDVMLGAEHDDELMELS